MKEKKKKDRRGKFIWCVLPEKIDSKKLQKTE